MKKTTSPQRQQIKRRRFVKTATLRTKRVIEHLRSLGMCGNRQNYKYSDVEVQQIFQAIERELKLCRAAFEEPQGIRFSLHNSATDGR